MINQYKLVLPEHLNHYGYLFGGNMLKWVDECSWIAASLDHPGCNFVTIGMDKVEFRRAVHKGAILRFELEKSREGNTSVSYEVLVFADNIETGEEELVFSTHVSFVCVDEAGNKQPLNKA
jgi:acyl-CoA hydrolase